MDSQRVRGATDLATYMAASVTYSATAAATVVFSISGSASRLVRVHRVLFSATQTVAGNIGDWRLEKRSTANTAGTSASMTAVPHDSGIIPATASVRNYTDNPSALGTLTGIIYQPRMLVPAPATAVNPACVFDLDCTALLNGQPISLRGVAEHLDLNFGGGTIPTGLANLQATVVWTEERK